MQLRSWLRFAALSIVLIGGAGCRDDGAEGESPSRPASSELKPDRSKADGEGLAEFIVAAFNKKLLRCGYRGTVAALKTEVKLFEPGADSGLFGQYKTEDYTRTTEPDPGLTSGYWIGNPPPSREAELDNLLRLFPNGRLAEGLEGYGEEDDSIPDWPFPPGNGLTLEALGGSRFKDVCEKAVANTSGGDPSSLHASYRRGDVAVGGNPTWVLSFPRGSVQNTGGNELRVEPARQLVVAKGPGGWSIRQFVPFVQEAGD